MSFFASRVSSPCISTLNSPTSKQSPIIFNLSSPKFSGSEITFSKPKIRSSSSENPLAKKQLHHTKNLSYSDNRNPCTYDIIIERIISDYKKSTDPYVDEIIDTFYFIKNKISLIDPKYSYKLNKIIEDYLTLIKKLTILHKKIN